MLSPSSLIEKRLTGRFERRTEQQGWSVGKIAGIAVLAVMISVGVLMPASAVAADSTGDEIRGHLAAGEYGLAIEKAQSITDETERAAQMRAISLQQEEAGDFDAARLTTRRTSSSNRSQETPQGGSTANPGPLMNMIRQLTGGPEIGPWEDAEGGGLGDEEGVGQMMFYQNGVAVDPNGMLQQLTRPELTKRLDDMGIVARKALLNQDLQKSNELRFVSLTRLEKDLSERLAKGEQPSETMKLLGGLTGVKYVFVMPEEKELVIAGPAEAWRYNEHGLAVGATSGRPVLQLDDLVVLMRTFGPAGNRTFGCSIDPREANLKSTKEYLASTRNTPLTPGALDTWLRQIEQRMGLQDIRIYGVPANSRVAHVIVDADYRMKLIGVGKMSGGKGIPNIFDLMAKSKQDQQLPLNAYRWWLTMKYDAVLHNEARNVYEIQGSSVLVKSEDQMISDSGKQVQSGKVSNVNRQFAENFTKNYSTLAKQDLVFADLQNIFDLGMVAALCHREHLADKIGWNLGAFADAGNYQPRSWKAPTTVKTVMAHRVSDRTDILVQAAGGVQANVLQEIRNENLVRPSADVKSLDRDGAAPASLPAGRWWWNGAE